MKEGQKRNGARAGMPVSGENAGETRQLLGPIPGWGLRWGITAILLATLLFLLLGWYIQYPDVVVARVAIVAENPPIRLLARQDGRISRLLVADQERVRAGQLLAVLENPASLADMDTLAAWMAAAARQGLHQAPLPERLRLGALQAKYASLLQNLREYRHFLAQPGTAQRIESLREQISYLEKLNSSLHSQEQTLAREVELARQNFERNQELYRSGAISQISLENTEAFYLQYRRQLEGLQAGILRNGLQAEELQARIIELQQQRSDEEVAKAQAVQRLFRELQSELEAWRQDYLLQAPVSGRISMSRPWREQETVRENELVMAVVPDKGAGPILARGLLPAAGSGKARPGMEAHLFLDAYPYQEFGILKGRLARLALLPEQGSYQAEIALPDSLLTTYGHAIPFTQELSATAEIITERRSLLGRVFSQLRSLAENR